ncbi:unnamed protein product [Rhodiola kirilowii]
MKENKIEIYVAVEICDRRFWGGEQVLNFYRSFVRFRLIRWRQ